MPMLAFTSSFDWHSLELQYTMDYKKQIFTLKMDGSMNVNRNFTIDESTLGCLKNTKVRSNNMPAFQTNEGLGLLGLANIV